MSEPAVFDISAMEVLMEGEGVELRRAEAGGDMTLLYVKCAEGTDFGPALAGLPHDMCCCEHWGTILEGRMQIETHDGQHLELSAGQAFHLLPGHRPSFPVDCAWYEFSPKDQVEKLLTHMGIG
ncbi:MAG: cupin domain-containing protein [Planctomycetota bacterium]|jgi:hypothetical protein